MFIPIQYLRNLIYSPLNRLFSRVVKPHSLSCSSQLRSLSSGLFLVALLCIISSVSISFLRYGLQACIQYSK